MTFNADKVLTILGIVGAVLLVGEVFGARVLVDGPVGVWIALKDFGYAFAVLVGFAIPGIGILHCPRRIAIYFKNANK